jgi:uncharacterized Tic20 family protein
MNTPNPSTPPAGSSTPSGDPSSDERNLGLLAHLSALAGFVFPLGNVLGPLIVWLTQKEKSAFVADQGAEALNFQITTSIVGIVLMILGFTIIGLVVAIPGFLIVGIGWLVLTIVGGVKASGGERYRYPFNWRLIK